MQETIISICRGLEERKRIRILFAVENGSRAWRMDSKDSDYDVRFAFVRPLEEYIQINKPEEVIEAAYDENGSPRPITDAVIDVVGFDIIKFAKMLSSSNPATIEWLISDIVYLGEQNQAFRKFALENYSPISLYHHYKSMCRNNYLKYLKSGNLVTYQKYLYAYRGLINAKWVVHMNTIPPIVFTDTLGKMDSILPGNVMQNLRDIIRLKSQGREKEIIQNIIEMDGYIESFLKDDTEAPQQKSHATLNALNEELRRIIVSQEKFIMPPGDSTAWSN